MTSISETYSQAIKLEQDGAAYYERQAQLHPESAIGKIFHRLADAERKHEAAIKAYEVGEGFTETAETQPPSMFAQAEDIRSEVRTRPDELEVYLEATEMERRSIELYQGMLAKATAEAEIKLLKWLVTEEEKHFTQMDELAKMIRHGDEYVTHAMFGNPPEY